MTFDEALQAASARKKIRRASWSPGMYVRSSHAGYLTITFIDGRRGMWVYTPEDKAAEDWEVM